MRILALLLVLTLHPDIVGTSKPAESLTAARIKAIPAPQQKTWLDYRARSTQQLAADKGALAQERAT